MSATNYPSTPLTFEEWRPPSPTRVEVTNKFPVTAATRCQHCSWAWDTHQLYSRKVNIESRLSVVVLCPTGSHVNEYAFSPNGIADWPDISHVDLGKPLTMPSVKRTLGLHQTPVKGSFEGDLAVLINKYSYENGSDTPDYILAKYMVECLHAFNQATKARSLWHVQQK